MTEATLLSLHRKIGRKRVGNGLFKIGNWVLKILLGQVKKVGLPPRTPAQNQPAKGTATPSMTMKLEIWEPVPNC